MSRRDMEPSMTGRAPGSFKREWNIAFVLVVTIATALLIAGRPVLAGLALALSATALVTRSLAMRRANRDFYGQEDAGWTPATDQGARR